jgi:pyruvate,orthophosphate dikinase
MRTTFSFSRVQTESRFLPSHFEAGTLRDNHFEVLDKKGVGELVAGDRRRPRQAAGAEGRHLRRACGDPTSIRFCRHAGLNYVSCSGPRVPIARLAAAHAKLKEGEYHAAE